MSELNLIFITYIIIANILSFAVVGLDKSKSVSGSSRIPEVYLFFWSLFLSSLGVLVGMFVFRHKTRKLYFTIGISLLFLQQIALILSVLGVLYAG